MKEPLLEVKNLSLLFRTYLGNVKAVRDISFSLYPGEVVALVGESGCGKSATAQAILGLIQTPPGIIENGEILFEGADLIKKSRKAMNEIRGKWMGIIFQDPMTSLNPTLRIGRQITEGLIRHHGYSTQGAKKRAVEMLTSVGISDPEKRFDHYPHQLSGGMRQRVMIAIALIHNPKLLIADEPTTALDVTLQSQILELMKSIRSSKKSTILLITHDLGIVAGIADRVMVMYGGKIVERGAVESIFHHPVHPYTQGLLRSVPRLDMDKKKELIPILGTPPSLLNPPTGCPFWARCPNAMRICKERFPDSLSITPTHEASCWLTSALSNKNSDGKSPLKLLQEKAMASPSMRELAIEETVKP